MDFAADDIKPATGRLGVLTPGLGAVATTFIAGVELIKRGLAEPVGSLTQVGTVRLGKRTEGRSPPIRELVPLAPLSSLVFGAWDIFPDDACQVALKAKVLSADHVEAVRDALQAVRPKAAAFDSRYIRNLSGPNVKADGGRRALTEALREDIRAFKKELRADRLVMIWCGSTEVFRRPGAVHESLAAFERGLDEDSSEIAPSQLYAYAAIMEGVPFANGAPNLTVDTKALQALALKQGVPIAGKDFKTGQTLMKTILAPGLKARLLGMDGWFSTNILGNRDGEVLDDPESFKSKEVSKTGVLSGILQPDLYPGLYGKVAHKVTIHYYPPRGDAKEGWDAVDIFGWLGYPMQIKINFQCRDSILAAPLVLDLALFMDFAQRSGMGGIQEWLSFYFKSPMAGEGLYPEHDLFIQQMKLKNTLRHLMGETLITHLGLDYYGHD